MYNRCCSFVLLFLLLLTGCDRTQPSLQTTEEQPKGRILVWHPFKGKEGEVLESLLDEYSELYPEVKIVREYVPREKMDKRLIQQTPSGLGPDLSINWNLYIPKLIDAGMLQILSKRDVDPEQYLPAAIDQVQLQGKLYGIPLSINLQVMCYNKTIVSKPAKTFEGLLQEATEGRRVALTSTFFETFWGAQAFGGYFINKKGQILLDNGGWAAWVNWLKQAQNEPNFILSDDRHSLREAFAAGEVGYHVCDSFDIPKMKESLGVENLGVTLLPTRAGQPSGPPILTNTLMFSRVSSAADRAMALHVAKFLTNPQQQLTLVLGTESQIPTNKQVEIDKRLSLIEAMLLTQAKTSVSIPLEYTQQGLEIEHQGNTLYKRVLAGEIDAQAAAEELTETVNRKFGH